MDRSAPNGAIRVSNCEDAKPLLKILGYRVREECGKSDTSLETADPERAFVTIDSGFPLPALEQTLQGGKPFEYPYTVTRAPIIFPEAEWLAAGNKKDQRYSKDLIDTLLHDPGMARLYWSLSRLDPETRDALQRTVGIRDLMPDAAVLDFYGSYICIRSGHVVVPGGENAVPAWKSLVGANPDSPAISSEPCYPRIWAGWQLILTYSPAPAAPSEHSPTESARERSTMRFAPQIPNASATKGAFRPAPRLAPAGYAPTMGRKRGAARTGWRCGVERHSAPEK